MKNNHNLFGIYGCEKFNISDNTILIENDIIGTSFVFLSRIEELNNNQDKFVGINTNTHLQIGLILLLDLLLMNILIL